MISKRELLVRIIDLEMINLKYEEEIIDLIKRVEKLEKPAKQKVTKKR